MPTFTYAGDSARDFPGDGMRPSFTLEPGGTVELDDNPWPEHLMAEKPKKPAS